MANLINQMSFENQGNMKLNRKDLKREKLNSFGRKQIVVDQS